MEQGIEKLIIAHLVKKFLVFYAKRKFITMFTEDHRWTLYRARRIHSTVSQLLHFNVLPSIPKFYD